MFDLDRKDVLRRCERLASTPGVVEVGARYLSVRPRLFARSLFEAAWLDAIDENAGRFIDGLQSALQCSLLKQAGTHGSNAVRDAIADWAIPWVRELSPRDLGASCVLERLVPLLEVILRDSLRCFPT
jgi:hypothetical protein